MHPQCSRKRGVQALISPETALARIRGVSVWGVMDTLTVSSGLALITRGPDDVTLGAYDAKYCTSEQRLYETRMRMETNAGAGHCVLDLPLFGGEMLLLHAFEFDTLLPASSSSRSTTTNLLPMHLSHADSAMSRTQWVTAVVSSESTLGFAIRYSGPEYSGHQWKGGDLRARTGASSGPPPPPSPPPPFSIGSNISKGKRKLEARDIYVNVSFLISREEERRENRR
ncbi:uncharacterized protein STEHIDRAFT_110681 [Stereum hirsutum FP-91666 SS1]|uniref:uncharacterized protein n=1 Tax=Stereum hirsutum (strain FP-91666) TaxID=721885 RepID=UPI000440D081|nr:uncharacterized protein STEHIDRAFT_110681 [Stereum hirsutum FP-91666 SS1]EIM87471.1 hypothetical protein STEHIDRAFT_110681 [Stereum hirsutum FP-91666 SS1]